MLGQGCDMPGRPMYVCPHCKTRIPFGTPTKPAPDQCPSCKARLSIPTVHDGPEWLLATCPKCGHKAIRLLGSAGRPHRCEVCEFAFTLPDNLLPPGTLSGP
jgi:hypothetical protein